MTDPILPTAPWMKTIQGAWLTLLQDEFAGDYDRMVQTLAGFAHLNVSNVAGYGLPGCYPHPKPFAGYSPASLPLSLGNVDGPSFVRDIKRYNPQIRIFVYSTPLLDCVERSWNARVGMPSPGDWSAGGFENFRNSLWAIQGQLGELYDGVYLDLCAPGFLSSAQLAEAVAIVRGFNKYVCLNFLYANLTNAAFACSPPALGIGDVVFVEGLYRDGLLGYTEAGSKAVAEYMGKRWYPQFAGVVEADPSETYAGMQSGPAYQDWLNGYFSCWWPYYRPGFMVEHNRADYAYVGAPGGA